MIGLQVTVVDEINHSGGSIRYSGLNWNARLAEEANVEVIGSTQVCVIAAITGTTMLVKPI
jgi:membrane protein implicated in regulation of membrane protease activity